jgi:hypothetical protein
MTDPLSPQDHDRLAAVLDAYGADPARWPAADRARFAQAIAGAPPAGMGEARALDALLSAAASPEPPAGAMDRLMARAAAPPAAVSGEPLRMSPRPARPQAPRLKLAPVWTALAASLLLGFWAGSAGLVDGVLLDAAPEGDWSAIDLSLRDDGDGA